MFKWLKRLLGSDQPSDIHVHVHVDGNLKVYHDGQQNTFVQGPQVNSNTTEGPKGSGRTYQAGEGDIRPELFTDLGTPEVSFGRDVELPPTGRKDEGNKIP